MADPRSLLQLELQLERRRSSELADQVRSLQNGRGVGADGGPDVGGSELQRVRRAEMPPLPAVLRSSGFSATVHESLQTDADIKDKFPCTYGGQRVTVNSSGTSSGPRPLRIGLVLSGGQAPGGHNVIAGVYDAIKSFSPESVLVGFTDGPQGIYNNKYVVVTDALMDLHRNTGGFDMLGSGRHKIEKPEEFASSMANCQKLRGVKAMPRRVLPCNE